MKWVNIEKLWEEVVIMMSCKGLIKVNYYLWNDEIFVLFEMLRKIMDLFMCLYGWLIIIYYLMYEMEKMFKWVM